MSTTESECKEDNNHMSVYEAATPPSVWIQELEPGKTKSVHISLFIF